MTNTRDEGSKRRGRLGPRLALCGALLLIGTPAAHAGWLDGLLAQSPTPAASANARQRSWPIREFTRIELVPREAGSEPNQHPATLQADALRQLLGQIQYVDRNGAPQALFAADELADLAMPLVQALGRAGPGDDVLLLSSSRRDGGILMAPTAVTARLFVQGGSLQFIVRDARFEFYDAYRGTQAAPRFTFGSRSAAGTATVQSPGASRPRADWLSIPMQTSAQATAQSGATAAPAPVVQVAPPPARKALDAAAVDDIERRLEILKRLREKGLITEDEYQQKRKEILQLL
jgi:hypothetical protein